MKPAPLRRALLLAASLCLAGSLHAAGNGPSPYPAESDEVAWPGVGPVRVGNWMTDQRAYFWTLRTSGQNAVVFVGDSLIGGWKNLRQAFPGVNVANRGIGGDVSRGVLFRFQEDVLDLHPKAIVLCVGTNDLSAHGKADHTISNISTMVEWAAEADPKMLVVLHTIPPRNVPNAPIVEGSLDQLNDRLKAFVQGKANLALVDLHSAFSNPDGSPNPEFIGTDGIHLTAAGFEKWTSLLRPLLEARGVMPAPAPAK